MNLWYSHIRPFESIRLYSKIHYFGGQAKTYIKNFNLPWKSKETNSTLEFIFIIMSDLNDLMSFECKLAYVNSINITS
jgi:hypothetical protein